MKAKGDLNRFTLNEKNIFSTLFSYVSWDHSLIFRASLKESQRGLVAAGKDFHLELVDLLCSFYVLITWILSFWRGRTEFQTSLFHFKDLA